MKSSILALFIMGVLAMSLVSAVNDNANELSWGSLRINGDYVDNGEVLAVEEGQTLDIRVGLVADNGARDVEVDAKISGYEGNDREGLYDSVDLIDVQAGNTKYVNMQVALPARLEKAEYALRLRMLDQNGAAEEKNIVLSVEPKRHSVEVQDVTLSPGNSIKAGRSILVSVLLANWGDKDEKDVKVTVSVPQLGISATEFVDLVATDDNNVEYEDVPEMFLPIPATAAAGEYQVKVTVDYDGFDQTVIKTTTLNVVANEQFAVETTGKLVLAVGPESQTVAIGAKAVYGVALTNDGRTSRAYAVEAVTGDFATVAVSENLVVLSPGQSKVVYVEVTPNANAALGDHIVSVSVKSGADMLETVALKATVTGTQNNGMDLKNGLEIALIVLIVLLVIIGLVIGFSRLKKDDDEEKTYY